MYRYTRNTKHETRRFRVSTSQLYTRVTCDQRSPSQVLTRATRGQHAEKYLVIV